MKAIRSLEQHVDCLLSYDFSALSKEDLYERLKIVDDQRIWVIAEALRKGITYEEIHDITMIDLWFIDKIQRIVEMEDARNYYIGLGKTQGILPKRQVLLR